MVFLVEPKISKNFKLKESTNLLLEYASKRFQKTQTSIVEWGIQLIFEQTFNKKEVSPIDIQNLEENLEQETDITREILIQVKEEITKKNRPDYHYSMRHKLAFCLDRKIPV